MVTRKNRPMAKAVNPSTGASEKSMTPIVAKNKRISTSPPHSRASVQITPRTRR